MRRERAPNDWLGVRRSQWCRPTRTPLSRLRLLRLTRAMSYACFRSPLVLVRCAAVMFAHVWRRSCESASRRAVGTFSLAGRLAAHVHEFGFAQIDQPPAFRSRLTVCSPCLPLAPGTRVTRTHAQRVARHVATAASQPRAGGSGQSRSSCTGQLGGVGQLVGRGDPAKFDFVRLSLSPACPQLNSCLPAPQPPVDAFAALDAAARGQPQRPASVNESTN